MNQYQKELLDLLVSHEPTAAAKKFLKRTFQQFVLEYGSWYEPAPLPDGITHGPKNECFKNAALLTTSERSLIYCEGFALWKSGHFPTLHAWVTDGSGRAIDNTWPSAGVAYAGVPFKSLFVTVNSLKNRAAISLLDDWQNKFPLGGELGDRPGEWLELGGTSGSEIECSIDGDGEP